MYLIEEETKLAKLRLLAGLLYKNLIEFLTDIRSLSESQHLDFLLEDPELKEIMLEVQSGALEHTETVMLLLAKFYSMSAYEYLKDYNPQPESDLAAPKKSLALLPVGK